MGRKEFAEFDCGPGCEADPWPCFARRPSQCRGVVLVVVRLIPKMLLGQHHEEDQNLVDAGIPQSSEGLY